MAKRREKTVLFLCTGNYYRSRFAEILFNSVAGKMGLPWRALSRGLALERGVNNVGPAVAADLRRLGITTPSDLTGRDPYALYDDLCRITGQRHDPCLLDTFIAAVRYMEGAPKKPWWKYTAERKREMAARNARSQ